MTVLKPQGPCPRRRPRRARGGCRRNTVQQTGKRPAVPSPHRRTCDAPPDPQYHPCGCPLRGDGKPAGRCAQCRSYSVASSA
eukprot:5695850-Prymnesium_polylepis.1